MSSPSLAWMKCSLYLGRARARLQKRQTVRVMMMMLMMMMMVKMMMAFYGSYYWQDIQYLPKCEALLKSDYIVFLEKMHIQSPWLKCKNKFLLLMFFLLTKHSLTLETRERPLLVQTVSSISSSALGSDSGSSSVKQPSEVLQHITDWAHSPVICSIDRCPGVGPVSSIYVSLPEITEHTRTGFRTDWYF